MPGLRNVTILEYDPITKRRNGARHLAIQPFWHLYCRTKSEMASWRGQPVTRNIREDRVDGSGTATHCLSRGCLLHAYSIISFDCIISTHINACLQWQLACASSNAQTPYRAFITINPNNVCYSRNNFDFYACPRVFSVLWEFIPNSFSTPAYCYHRSIKFINKVITIKLAVNWSYFRYHLVSNWGHVGILIKTNIPIRGHVVY